MTKYENIHKMILTTILLESNLKHEHDLRTIRLTIETEFKKRIERCEKYNGETLRDFLEINPKNAGLDIFIENAHDLLADFIGLFVDLELVNPIQLTIFA